MSKLVCTHKNEWAYDIDTIKAEAQEVYDTGMGKNPSEKLKKQVESRILVLETKMKELMFWNDAKDLAYTGEIDTKLPARVFPSTDNVHHFHPIAWVRQMKLILGNGGDHGDYHDPVINPQVRGWYGSDGHNPNSSIARWNPYGSMKMHKDVNHLLSDDVKNYGKPQRSSGSHNGLDIYAPVGTPIYACVDGTIKMHEFANKTSGFKIKLFGKYKKEKVRFNYIHLMEFKKTKFRFHSWKKKGWINYEDYRTPKQYTDPKVGETYTIFYNGSELKIDNNVIDVNLVLSIEKNMKVEKGQVIGYTGSTGNSYQGKKMNHLHFNTYIKGKGVQPYEKFKEYIGLDVEGTDTSSKQDGLKSSGKW